MSKELYVTSTPHETKLAVVDDDQLVEVFFERENEYTLAGSIYKGKVTRVLPGMQSAFVDIGLERDAFLYVTDFLEEVEEDDTETAKAAPAEGERGERPERSERQERGRGRDRGRRNRFERNQPQQAAPAPEEGSFTIEHDSTAGTDDAPEMDASAEFGEGDAPSLAAGAGTQEGQQGAEERDQDRRGGRRWRGRRGRRRRGVPEAKFAQPEGGAPEAEESGEPVATHRATEEDLTDTDSQAHFLGESTEPESQVSESPTEVPEREARPRRYEEQPRGERRDERRDERQEERRPERSERPRPAAIVLPGESLAKFGRKVEEEKPKAGTPGGEGRTVLPRPSTEYTAPTGFAAAGLLAGESLAKYRNRPAEPQREERRPQVREEEPRTMMPAPMAEPDEAEAPVATPVPVQSAEPAAVEAVLQSPERTAEVSPEGEGYGFRPGHGVVEEEEIEDEEHEFAPLSEQLEEGEFEELEEETLEDQREDEMIAAGEGLAEAFVRSREEEATAAGTYLVDEEEEDEEGEEAEGEEIDEADEAEVFADDAGEEPEAVDPEDPNYSGRAEMRGGPGTAGLQQRSERTERGGFERRRGGRDRDRGRRGRPPMRRGGPRRNIPRGPMPQIGELLKEGQEILVQIAKEPMAKKGARITSHIALPGRFLVFMPTVNHTGVSRKIGSDEERQRLKRILLSEKGQSSGGFIVRTAAAGASEDDLRADIRFLINLWGEIKQRAESSKAPALIYHDLNLVERILRDQVTSNFSQIWVDTEPEYERILRFASRFQPSLVKRVKLYTKDTPLFEQFNITEEINKALKSKVWLKSGGYIVINQTEALVAIDINTGKYVGKTGRLEDTIVKTNLDAIKEIVRQIRLRDLGGIIIIDFIDMDERKNRQKVMQALEAELKNDRSPSKVLQFNDFGLVAITRKRVKQSLERTLSTPCSYCTGTGMTKSVATVCNEIYVEMRKMYRHLEGSQIMLRVHPEVGKALKENQGRWLVEMEELTGKSIIVKSDPAQHQEQFDIH